MTQPQRPTRANYCVDSIVLTHDCLTETHQSLISHHVGNGLADLRRVGGAELLLDQTLYLRVGRTVGAGDDIKQRRRAHHLILLAREDLLWGER